MDKIGSIISFCLDRWDEKGNHFTEIVKLSVYRICEDPFRRHETKYLVKVKNESFGIPISNVLELNPKAGTQLNLF